MNDKSNSTLASLVVLLGEWTMASPQYPGFQGRATFEWIEDGAYLRVRDEVEKGEFPSGVWIIGADDSTEDSTALDYDSRAVRRVYQMSFVDGVWKIWRNAAEFNQRFIGKMVGGGKTITGRWEMSQDASEWKTDFDLIYQKTG